MALPALADALYVFVFGPGTGELVAVRAPPDDWLIVDGCGVGRTKYGPALLAHYGAAPRMRLRKAEMKEEAIRIAKLRDKLETGLLGIEGTKVNGSIELRMPNITNILFDGIDSEALIMALDRVIVFQSYTFHRVQICNKKVLT